MASNEEWPRGQSNNYKLPKPAHQFQSVPCIQFGHNLSKLVTFIKLKKGGKSKNKEGELRAILPHHDRRRKGFRGSEEGIALEIDGSIWNS